LDYFLALRQNLPVFTELALAITRQKPTFTAPLWALGSGQAKLVIGIIEG
jgi:hypothetical protein